jgi:hypothetical protein
LSQSPVAQPLVYVVVLNYRNYDDTINCVRTLEAIRYDNYRIVIVDNDSGNESEVELRRAFPHHTLVQSGANLGYAGGNNVGIRVALDEGADYVAILNNDTLLDPDFLTELVDYAEQYPSAGLMTPLLLDVEGGIDTCCTRRRLSLFEIFWNRGIGRRLWPVASWEARHFYEGEVDYREPVEVEIISGASMFLRRELIEEIGLLDEETFLFYEEFILHEKIKQTAFRTMIVPASRVTHIEHQSLGQDDVGPVIANIKSLNVYLRKYRSVSAPMRWLIVASVFLDYAPGLVKSLTGMRTSQTRSRKAN